jgi:hypothetical protein
VKAQCTKIEKHIGIDSSAQPPTSTKILFWPKLGSSNLILPKFYELECTHSTREIKITELEAPISSAILKEDIKIKSNEFILRDDQTKDIEDEEIV